VTGAKIWRGRAWLQ